MLLVMILVQVLVFQFVAAGWPRRLEGGHAAMGAGDGWPVCSSLPSRCSRAWPEPMPVKKGDRRDPAEQNRQHDPTLDSLWPSSPRPRPFLPILSTGGGKEDHVRREEPAGRRDDND